MTGMAAQGMIDAVSARDSVAVNELTIGSSSSTAQCARQQVCRGGKGLVGRVTQNVSP